MARTHDDFVRLHDAFGNVDAALQRVRKIGVDESRDLHAILLRHLESRVREPLGTRAVVRKKNEPFAILIQASYGKEATVFRRHKVNDAATSARVVVRTQRVLRFIERDVRWTRLREPFPVDLNLMLAGYDANAQIRYHATVDFNASVENELLDLTTTAESSRS